VGLVQSYAKALCIDLGFVIQGEEDEELPEHILGCVRLSRLDLSLPGEIQDVEDDYQAALSALGT
jgi:hypothetical protein